MLVISPHLDDAVLGLGQHMTDNPGGTCVTVFAGAPDPYPKLIDRPHDDRCGFDEDDDVVAIRRDEDQRALDQIGWKARHLGFLDCQYHIAERPRKFRGELIDALLGEWEGTGRPGGIWAPLAISHPDHTYVRDVAAQVCRVAGVPLVVWAEPGYRSRFLTEAENLIGIRTDGWLVEEVVWPMEKLRALLAYESQLHGITAAALADALTYECYGKWRLT